MDLKEVEECVGSIKACTAKGTDKTALEYINYEAKKLQYSYKNHVK